MINEIVGFYLKNRAKRIFAQASSKPDRKIETQNGSAWKIVEDKDVFNRIVNFECHADGFVEKDGSAFQDSNATAKLAALLIRIPRQGKVKQKRSLKEFVYEMI